MPSKLHELAVPTVEKAMLEDHCRMPHPNQQGWQHRFVALDALARTAAVIISGARDHHAVLEALDAFRRYLEAALMAKGVVGFGPYEGPAAVDRIGESGGKPDPR